MNIFELFQTIGTNVWIYGGTFVLVLSILVFVHEWGHYIVARLCGVRIDTFSIGFGKEIAGFNDKHGTRWKVSMIPLGGYVKMFGDVDPASAGHADKIEDPKTGKMRKFTKAEREQAFYGKPVWKRAAIVAAGPGINYIFAIILLTGLYALSGQPVTPPLAAAVIEGSSADKAGFEPHDLVLSIDGKPTESFEDIRRSMLIGLDFEKHFVVERGGKKIDIYAKPEKVEQEDRFGFKSSRGLLGLTSPRHGILIDDIAEIDGNTYKSPEALRNGLERRLGTTFEITMKPRGEDDDTPETYTVHPFAAQNEGFISGEGEQAGILFLTNDKDAQIFIQHGPIDAFTAAVKETWDITAGTLEALGQMITGSRPATELGGIIRIGAIAGDMAQQGILALIVFTALLSINLGLINLFPIPMLDGGHLLFYTFEAALGKPIPEKIQDYAFRAGLVFLVGVMVFANLNDLIQIFL